MYTLEREIYNNVCTLGKLHLDKTLLCVTLEPSQKSGKLIPKGLYDIDISFSPKFGKPMCELVNVPERDNILIHTGNFPIQTKGCILVGESVGLGQIYINYSRKAYTLFWNSVINCLVNFKKLEIQVL